MGAFEECLIAATERDSHHSGVGWVRLDADTPIQSDRIGEDELTAAKVRLK